MWPTACATVDLDSAVFATFTYRILQLGESTGVTASFNVSQALLDVAGILQRSNPVSTKHVKLLLRQRTIRILAF